MAAGARPAPEEHLSSKNCRSVKSEVSDVLYREIQKKVENSLHICVDFRQLKFHTPFHPLGDVNTHGSFAS